MSMDGVTPMPPMKCPACGRIMTASGESPFDPAGTEPRPHGPQPGDTTICAYCLVILVFNDDLTIRRMTAEEWKALPPEVAEGIVVLQFAVQQAFKQARGRNPESN